MTKDFCDICKKEIEMNYGALRIRTDNYPGDKNTVYEYYDICGGCVDKMKDLMKEISAID